MHRLSRSASNARAAPEYNPPSVTHPIARILIVDDERLARVRGPNVARHRAERARKRRLTGDCGTLVESWRPDAVFLDVQMPEMDGFGVVQAVGADKMPPTVFVTAYDQHALRAFDVAAVDYLLAV
jgi:two-component system LytT family response regulator